MEGTTSGIQINSTMGQPGEDPTVRIRGIGTVNGSSFHAQFAVTVAPEGENNWCWVYPAKEIDYNGLIDNSIE